MRSLTGDPSNSFPHDGTLTQVSLCIYAYGILINPENQRHSTLSNNNLIELRMNTLHLDLVHILCKIWVLVLI